MRMASRVSFSWVVTKTASFQIAGVELPQPGSGVFQATFLVLLHLVGRFLPGATLSAVGPRHCGQTSSAATARCEPGTRSNPNTRVNSIFRPPEEEHSKSAKPLAYHIITRNCRP